MTTVRIGFIPVFCDTCNLAREEDEELDEYWVIHQDHTGHLCYEDCKHTSFDAHSEPKK